MSKLDMLSNRSTFFLVLAMLLAGVLKGQTEYGYEWINYDQDYIKVAIAKDGFYRVSKAQLNTAGLPAGLSGDQLQLFWLGDEQKISVSNDGVWVDTDYFEFYGEQNRSQLDRRLWENPEQEMLNPDYSLYTDTSYYFLTWSSGTHQRYPIAATEGTPSLRSRPHFRHTEKINLHDELLKPAIDAQGVSFSVFVEAEGFASGQTTSLDQQISTPQIATGGTPPSLAIRMSGNSQDHEIEVTLNNRLVVNPIFQGSILVDTTLTLDITDITQDNTIGFRSSSSRDRFVVSTIDLEYDHLMVFENQSQAELTFNDAEEGVYFEMAEFSHGGIEPVVLDLSSGILISPVLENDLVKITLPGGGSTRHIRVFARDSGLSSVISVEPIEFNSLAESNAQYIIISNEKLFAGSDGENWVQNYAEYRASAQGGNYRTQIITIDDLTDQFSFGVSGHPFAIKNFANYAKANWEDPQYIFIIGRGYHYDIVRTESRVNNFVPTFGIPGSDNLLVAAGNSPIPLIPIGRLGASNSDDIRIYLDKVKTLEDLQQNAPQTIEDREWMKQVLHLSAGGVRGNERLILEQSLASMAKRITGVKFGAEVRAFSKNTQDIITREINEDLTKHLEEGVVLRTYFGHGGIVVTELDYFEHPENFNNENRYPCMVSLGCHTGDMYTDAYSLSEENVLAEKRGSIAYIATSGLGFLSALSQFGDVWYDLLSTDLFGAPLGNSLQAALQTLGTINSVGMRTLAQQLTLHGDPAYRLSRPDTAPDLTFVASSARTEPASISSTIEEFEFHIEMVNLGATTLDSVAVTFRHILPSGQIASSTILQVPINSYRKALSVVLPNTAQNNSGKNIIQVVVNETQDKVEGPAPEAYNNNSLADGFVFFIQDNSIVPAYPCEFSIVNSAEDLTLEATTIDAFAKSQAYSFEIDTTKKFDSPFKQSAQVEQSGGIVSWKPEVPLESEKVYYWRVSPDSNATQAYLWQESSFTYVPGANEGWSQSHYEQLAQDQVSGFLLPSNKRMIYDSTGFSMTFNNGIAGEEVGVQFNFETFAASIRPWSVLVEGIAVTVGDPITGAAWVNTGGMFGSVNTTSGAGRRTFAFPTSTPAERELVVNFLENEIPDGHYVFFMTILRNADSDFVPEQWETVTSGASIYEALESQGARQVRMLKERGSVAYNFIYKKGKEALNEDIAQTKDEIITTTSYVTIPGASGDIISTLIGPAKTWGSLKWNLLAKETPDTNLLTVEVLNINLQATRTFTYNTEAELSLDFIDADTEPYLKLIYHSADPQDRTSSILDLWRITYEGYPDLAIGIDPDADTLLDTISRGEAIKIPYVYRNLTATSLDSILIRYTVLDDQNKSEVSDFRVAPLEAFGEGRGVLELATGSFNGSYRISIEINADQDQQEKSFLNNIGIYQLAILGENIAPLLEVTFDGEYIKESEIISPRPLINISLRDENRSQPIDDPSLFNVTLIFPDGSKEILDLSTDQRIDFTPATSSDQAAKIIFEPEFLEQGDYRLQVQGRDASGNVAGTLAYDIGFQVILEESISEVFNYPNPFNNSTQFVFTLTGESLPTALSIQIMTTSGQVVREISMEELGPLRRGVNRTDYRWDGTDSYGGKLANGIYLYRVRVLDESGGDFKRMESQTSDLFFERNIGKLVILR